MPAPPCRVRVLFCVVAVGLTVAGCGSTTTVGRVTSPTPPPAPSTSVDASPSAGPPVSAEATTGPAVPTAPASTPPSQAEGNVSTGGRVVVLDPGHNGGNTANPAAINHQVPDGRGGTKACNTTGTSTDAGYPEHAFTFAVAQGVAQRLRARGIRVVLTRDNDTGVGPCVDVRGRAGERANADAVVSIHADGAAPGGHGFHVAYSDPPLNGVQRGPARVLAADLRDGLVQAGFPTSTYIGHAGLSPRTDLAGLNFATRPTALIECANMRNPQEAAVVTSTAGRDRYAAAITDGILRFLGTPT